MADPASFFQWTKPVAQEHPRIFVSNSNGPTVASLQTRIGSAPYSTFWNDLKAWVNGHLSATSFPDSYFYTRDAEYTGALAFSYMLDPSGQATAGARAVTIALSTAALPLASGKADRDRGLLMAYVYDWCFPLLTSGNKSTLRTAIADRVASRVDINDAEYLWGVDHGDMVYAIVMLIAILEDSTAGNNDTRVGWMDTMFDALDDGSGSNIGFFPAFRFFGQDGGTHKGSGSGGYAGLQKEFYGRVFPSLKSALKLDLYPGETWYRGLGHWSLWHYRSDNTEFNQGEAGQQAKWTVYHHIHALQIARNEANLFGEAMQWFGTQIDASQDGNIWGPWQLHRILWHESARPATMPTIAGYAEGKQMRIFLNAGKICFREGWSSGDAAVVSPVEQYFVGGHQDRDAGNFDLAHNGEIMVLHHGHYDASQQKTHKIIGDPIETGHRYTYRARILSQNCLRIFDTDEPAEAMQEGFQRQATTTLSRFGVLSGGAVVISNDGGQRWIKSTDMLKYQPADLAKMLAEPKWNVHVLDDFPGAETAAYAYAVANLTKWYYVGKCQRYKRHFLWVKKPIGSWVRPVLLVWDDVDTHIDAVAGKKTKTLQVQTTAAGTLTGSRMVHTKNAAKLTYDILRPTGFELLVRSGFLDAQGVVYPPSETDDRDDSLAGVSRAEINPPSANAHDDFLLCYFPSSTASTPPVPGLIDDAQFIGATINSIECKMRRGNSHEAFVGTPDLTAPATPTGLGAVAGDALVTLDWNDNGETDLAGYFIYRQEKVAGIYQTELRIASTVQSTYVDNTVLNGHVYRYGVSAFDNAPTQNESAITARTADQSPTGGGPPPPGPPSAPTGVHAIAGDAQITVDWNDNPETGVSYNIYRERFLAGSWESETAEALSVGRPYLDLDVGNGITYRYRIGAVTVNGESARSAYSNEVTPNPPPTPDIIPPLPPTLLVATPGNNQVSLDWANNTETDLARYRVYRATKTAGVYGAFSQITEITDGPPPTSSYLDSGAVNETTYAYRVTALDTATPRNESAASIPVFEVTPSAPPALGGARAQRQSSIYRDEQQT